LSVLFTAQMAKHYSLLQELQNENLAGVAYKNRKLIRSILTHFANSGNATIPYLSKLLNTSVPKTGELIAELIEAGLVKDYGKTGSSVGRRPNIYGLASDSAFFVGVEVKNNYINIGLLDFKKNLVKLSERLPYTLSNTQQSLDELCEIVKTFIEGLKDIAEKVLGIGISLSGRINYKTGYSYSFFYFNEEPLSSVIERKIGIPTYLDNDSRAMAYGEFCSGVVHDEKDVLFINIDYGIAMGVMINGELYYGKSGFAGEFGHIPFFQNEILCHCGKKGCLETETSGKALIDQFRQKLREGASSLLNSKYKNIDDIKLDDIIDAANNDDTLAIELIAKVGEKLGKAIAALINLYNPELIILGGRLAGAGDYIYYPVKSAINKYSLSLVNNDTQLKISRLGAKAGVIGACLMVRNKLLG